MHCEVIIEPTAEGCYLARSAQAPGCSVVATSPDLALDFFKRSIQAWFGTLRRAEPWRDLDAPMFTWRLVKTAPVTPSAAPYTADEPLGA
jgi:predicted RNase H-like HicB family nuclease